jgi:hypothetical protein
LSIGALGKGAQARDRDQQAASREDAGLDEIAPGDLALGARFYNLCPIPHCVLSFAKSRFRILL